ncbi:hypothetical protein MYAM1_000392 [Malassezia yamatoensis]|uniref:Uncharacterized protein n=1 Tax=Malassezia yamatoensis TaxID=253288 RepID=A0AAJ5YR30_9BASI|nr:hypothetical protein MYAM1_000392 [Malassezia yamatoensis]
MPPKREKTHEERAAALLKRASSQTSQSPKRKDAPHSDGDQVLEMPRLIHALHTMSNLSVTEAMHAVRRLAQCHCTTRARLSRISAPELEEMGVGTTTNRDRLVKTLQTLGSASSDSEQVGLTSEERAGYQAKRQKNDAVRRDWGDAPKHHDDSVKQYNFHPVIDEETLRGRHVLVNRAPVMTAWSVVVLQYMGFSTPEALSIAQNYVGRTAHARAVAIGHAPRDSKEPSVSQKQPHISFMGCIIPVICLRSGTYRALHNGEIVDPDKAFNYMHKSMHQMLPEVIGAMMLLASSYMDHTWASQTEKGNNSSHDLEKEAYSLYTEFRPETHGEWGKRSELYLDKILALRRRSTHFQWPTDPPALQKTDGQEPIERQSGSGNNTQSDQVHAKDPPNDQQNIKLEEPIEQQPSETSGTTANKGRSTISSIKKEE